MNVLPIHCLLTQALASRRICPRRLRAAFPAFGLSERVSGRGRTSSSSKKGARAPFTTRPRPPWATRPDPGAKSIRSSPSPPNCPGQKTRPFWAQMSLDILGRIPAEESLGIIVVATAKAARLPRPWKERKPPLQKNLSSQPLKMSLLQLPKSKRLLKIL